jgi:hypothetical protein
MGVTTKTFCFCVPGIDASTINIELDQTSRQHLRISGKPDIALSPLSTLTPFSIERKALDGMRFVIARENISLTQGILTIRYTLESCYDFQKIY